MAAARSSSDAANQVRATAVRHAQDIEDRKRIQNLVADLVVEAFDLPSGPDDYPARPRASDVALFKKALGLFRPSDLDDLIYERNTDGRCGYALCPRPRRTVAHGGVKVWNRKGGKDFALVDRADLEKWCSDACEKRSVFVREQLATEPAWLRDVKPVDITLLDDMSSDDLAESFQALAISRSTDGDMAAKLQALALERRTLQSDQAETAVAVVEQENASPEAPPPSLGLGRHDFIEGHRPGNRVGKSGR